LQQNYKNNLLGFSLIEILIVFVLMGIMSYIALACYTQYITQTKRNDAVLMLTKLATALEEYYSIHQTYQNASLDELGFKKYFAGGRYELIISSATNNSFIIKANPIGKQAQDDYLCNALILNANGVKNITGTGQIENCWR
jgi:type IV pilus assembly protein PilE